MAQILLDLSDDLKEWVQKEAERREMSMNAWLRLLLLDRKEAEGRRASRKEGA